MMIRQFSEEEQAIFRKVMDAKGADKEEAIRQIIEKKLDDESAIVSWLKRIHEFDLYERLKNEPKKTNNLVDTLYFYPPNAGALILGEDKKNDINHS